MGSMDINGSYRDLFDPQKWSYVGLDMQAGKNVDLVPKDPYDWNEIEENSLDLVISGQAMEHIEFPWKTFENIARVLKPGALCCIIAPSAGPEHRHPVDCWRFFPDGMRALCKHAGLLVQNAVIDSSEVREDGSNLWKDLTLTAQKKLGKSTKKRQPTDGDQLSTMHSEGIEEPLPFSPRYESMVTAWHPHRRFAYSLIKEHRPSVVVELGVHYGDSYFTFCQACEELELGSKCYGVDHWRGDEHAGYYSEDVFREVSEYNDEFYSESSTLLRMDFADALCEFDNESIDFLHIDGRHDLESVKKDFLDWFPKVKDGGLILLHDVNAPQEGFGVKEFWQSIKGSHFTREDLSGFGLGVISKGASTSSSPPPPKSFFMEKRAPSPQNAIDLYKGNWASKFPKQHKLRSGGKAQLFEDQKLTWAIEQMGGVKGKHGLELGPLEGGHSYMLQKAGVKSLTSIESNSSAYQKCLIAKELLDMPKVKFLFGDFETYLEKTNIKYDFILACGILYHLKNPLAFLESAFLKSNVFFVWTHFYEEGSRKRFPDFFSEEIVLEFRGEKYLGSKHQYNDSTQSNSFLGGIEDHSVWMEKKLILDVFKGNGFETKLFQTEQNHPNGPCFSFLAKR